METSPLLWRPGVGEQLQGPCAINLKNVFPLSNLGFAALGKMALTKVSQIPRYPRLRCMAGHGDSWVSTRGRSQLAPSLLWQPHRPREWVTCSRTSPAPGSFPCSSFGGLGYSAIRGLVVSKHVWQRGSRLEEDAPCCLSQDAVTGLPDGSAFQGGAVGAGCCAAQASSWRVLNPWESPAGSNKHKHPNKPELKKLYLCHCLRKTHSCLQHVFSAPCPAGGEWVVGHKRLGVPVPIGSEVRSWGLTAKLRLFEAEGGLLALAWGCLHVAPSVYVPISWLAGTMYGQCVWLPWVGFFPSSKAVPWLRSIPGL